MVQLLILNLSVVLLCLFSSVISYSGWNFDLKNTKCGVLYSGQNFTLAQLEIRNGKLINDLSGLSIEDPSSSQYTNSSSGLRRVATTIYESSENWDNRTSSDGISHGCRLQACSQINLEGKCIWFNQSTPILEQNWDNLISSVGCLCPIENCDTPRCPSINLGPKTCARAFLEPSCQNCRGLFIDIKKNQVQTHFGGYENDVRSLVVHPNCQITFFTETEFEGDKEVLSGGFYQDFYSSLGSYECECTEETSEDKSPPPPLPRNPDFPNLLEFPSTAAELKMLAQRFPGHTGIDAALTSFLHRRSSRNAYILLIGLTGAGKSSTINFLFDNETICAAGSTQSTTEAIHEYRIPIQVDELGCKNCELRVIDTPGFGDTRGLEKDAKFLAGLETYLSTHEELRDRLPNIILIMSKYTDNRIEGRSSPLVKTLRGIELFKERLFDSKYSNAITVLTHFLGETKKKQKNPAPKIRGFRRVVEDYTLLPRPITIVIAENRPDEEELAAVNGYYLLPNGDYYPQNLFETIQNTAVKGHDPVGEAIIRTAFKSPENFKITEKVFHLTNVSFIRENVYLGELNSGNFENFEQSEISNLTDLIYKTQVPPALIRKYPGTLEYVQRVLNLQNINTKQNIPRTTMGILQLFKNLRQNELVQLLLSKSLGLEVPGLEIPLITGQCYDLLTDSVLPVSPFVVTSKEFSDIGFKLPNTVSSVLTRSTRDIFKLYNTKDDYSQDRISSLKIGGAVKAKMAWRTRPGYNTLETFDSLTNTNRRSVTAIREYRLFELQLNQNLTLTPEFIQRIKTIPEFDPANHTIVDDWKYFFTKYGTHVVNSAYGGGGIEVEFKLKNESMTTDEAKLAIKKPIQDLFKFLEDVYLGKSLASNDINTDIVTYSLRYIGGDYKFYVQDFSNTPIDKTARMLDDFRESLEYQPAMLQSAMSLIPLSEIVNKLNVDFGYKISNATAILFNATLTYIPPPPPPPPLERPEVKKIIDDLKAQFSVDVGLLSQSLNASRDGFEKLIKQMIAENEKERREIANRTLQRVSLNCNYEQADLRGESACLANADTCVSVYMKTVRSTNTHDACVQYFKGGGCQGRSYPHTSNSTWNTKFPFDMTKGGFFSVLNCGVIPGKSAFNHNAGKCASQIDLVIVLDGSGSISTSDFLKAKQSVAKLIGSFGTPSRSSLIVYSSTATTVYSLTNSLTPSGIQSAILNANYPGQGTATNLGIDAAVSEFRNSNNQISRNMVVFTDGYSNNYEETRLAAERAISYGITTFAVGIGGYSLKELNTIADNKNDHVFTTTSFDQLIHLIAPVFAKICVAI